MRPEYRALVDELPALLGEFGCALDDRGRADIEIFTIAVDRIDRELDAIRDRGRRRRFADDCIAALEHPVEDEGAELGGLRGVLARRGLGAPFRALTSELLDTSERVRGTRDAGDYLELVEREGGLLVELVLLLLGESASAGFAAFIRAVAAPANLVDKLIDARGDHRRGELQLHPGLGLHARLAGRALRRAPQAVLRHPRRLRLIAWGLRFVPMLLASA